MKMHLNVTEAWTKAETLLLLRLMKRHPVLYFAPGRGKANVSFIQAERKKALQAIRAEMAAMRSGITVYDVKTKMKTIRSQVMSEIRRRQQGYTGPSKLWCYAQSKFLFNYIVADYERNGNNETAEFSENSNASGTASATGCLGNNDDEPATSKGKLHILRRPCDLEKIAQRTEESLQNAEVIEDATSTLDGNAEKPQDGNDMIARIDYVEDEAEAELGKEELLHDPLCYNSVSSADGPTDREDSSMLSEAEQWQINYDDHMERQLDLSNELSEHGQKRRPYFTEADKGILLQLVKQNFHLLQPKQNDGIGNQRKAEIWTHITQKFNEASSTTARSIQHIRAKYVDMKKTLRSKVALLQRRLCRTGGDQALRTRLSANEKLLLSLIGPFPLGSHSNGGEYVELSDCESDDQILLDDIAESDTFAEDTSSPQRNGDSSSKRSQYSSGSPTYSPNDSEEEEENLDADFDDHSYEKLKKIKLATKNDHDDKNDLRSQLLNEKIQYYKQKNRREHELFNMDMKIKKAILDAHLLDIQLKELQKTEQYRKLNIVKHNV